MMTTAFTAELLATLGEHLTGFELPALASVHLTIGMAGPQVCVQLDCHRQPPVIAADLLAWADTLTQTSAEAWRPPHGDTVHLSITGRLPCGTEIQIYEAVAVTDVRVGADLAPGARTTLPLAALRHLTTPGLVTEEVTL
jgi:hypothetical protein